MTIAKAELLDKIAEDLNGFGSFDISDGSHFQRSLSNALADFWREKAWSFKIAESTITTTEDNLGPYDLPSDFDGFMTPDRVDIGFAWPASYTLDNPIKDGAEGQRYQVTWNRRDDKLYFARYPGVQDLTLVYRKSEPTIDDMSVLPDESWVREALTLRTAYHTLKYDEETMAAAANYGTIYTQHCLKEWNHQRKGQIKQQNRTVMSPHGYPLKVGLSGYTGHYGVY